MIELAIRDDDMNFFTRVSDIEKVYEPIRGFPVSFAIIPMVTDVSTKGSCSDTCGNTIPHWIGDNNELVVWLKKMIHDGHADALLHGITHGYQFIDGKRYAEMEWRKEPKLLTEIAEYKARLSELLDYPVSVFVAPSNKISKYGLKCVAANGLHYSGIVPASFDRELTVRNVGNYIKRWYYRVKDKLPYPNVMQYSDHKEINACLMQGYDYLLEMFRYCVNTGSPMAVNVHYWHLRDNDKEREDLCRFVDFALNHGAKPATLSELLE